MKKKIVISAPFSARYTLTIDSNVKTVNATLDSKTQIRWDFRVIRLYDDYFEAELLQLDHVLLEANNPLIKEIASLTQVFGRLYNELHLQIDYSGKVLNILNSDLVLSKWQQTKNEMQKIAEHNADIKSVITLNDYIFTNKDKLKAAVQGSEFFLVYFNKIFGNFIPYFNGNILSNNFFNTDTIHWQFDIKEDTSQNNSDIFQSITLAGEPSYPLQKEFYKKAYQQFAEQIDISGLSTDLWERGSYQIEKQSGRVQQAVLKRAEIADKEKLYTTITYSLVCSN